MADFTQVHNVDDFKRLARGYLPRPIFDWIEGGAEDEVSLVNNRMAFERVRFKPRTLVDVTTRDQTVELFGKPMASPFAIAPMGNLSLFWPNAEVVMAQAAVAAGIPFVLSTASAVSLETVAEQAPGGRLWFQLYVFKDAKVNRSLVDRAAAAGYEALMVTTDTHMFPKRERDRRNGIGLNLKKTPANIAAVMARPRWLWDVVLSRPMPKLANLEGEVSGPTTYEALANYFLTQRHGGFDLDDLKRLRDQWKGKLMVKGILNVEDALRAVEVGCDGVILSNHGGRNLEGSAAPFEVLPEVIDGVGGKIPVLLDSGFRRGSDIVKALAIGAKAVMLGRPAAYAVSGAGKDGVAHLLATMKDEVDRVQGYVGCKTLAELGRDLLLFDRQRPGANTTTI
jgi:(S)-mandelate dehydrogenase